MLRTTRAARRHRAEVKAETEAAEASGPRKPEGTRDSDVLRNAVGLHDTPGGQRGGAGGTHKDSRDPEAAGGKKDQEHPSLNAPVLRQAALGGNSSKRAKAASWQQVEQQIESGQLTEAEIPGHIGGEKGAHTEAERRELGSQSSGPPASTKSKSMPRGRAREGLAPKPELAGGSERPWPPRWPSSEV